MSFPPAPPAPSVPLSTVAAKGDLIVAPAGDQVARLPVGADGTLLVADSTQPDGVKWGTVSAPLLIARQVLAADASTVTFSNIPQTFENLILDLSAWANGNSGQPHITIRFNGDSAAHYIYGYTNGGSVYSFTENNAGTYGSLTQVPALTASDRGSMRGVVLGYARTDRVKQLAGQGGYWNSGGSTFALWHAFISWQQTAAITSITFGQDSNYLIGAGSVFSIYGEP